MAKRKQTNYEVIRYLLDEAEAREKEIQDLLDGGKKRWLATYGKAQLIKDNMKKIRQIALKISKEVNE